MIALSGGIGGAKLALGLYRVLDPGALTVICNTADDFRHLGLHIAPDLDTVLYTLSGLSDPDRGWGRGEETWQVMDSLEALGGETWFRLGDKDLATHLERTHRLRAGETLSGVTERLRRRLGISAAVVPMSDDAVRTRLLSAGEWIDFQHYFVRLRCEPVVEAIAFAGAEQAAPAPGVLSALRDPRLQAVVICPSNPLVSIEPILAVSGIREALRRCTAPVIGVSPLIGARALRGPAAKLMNELGLDASAGGVARRYAGLIDAWIVDETDAHTAVPDGVERVATRIVMLSLEDRERLARDVLEVARRLSGDRMTAP